ncbi:MAG: bifunctional glutamate N-acetyltransferase/amino-acid acetyltransferase ArgJ [Magnetococcales bacterium]|nr:bifunctional glutamate N-acetyltransferase/amino-acid acetyltransferase ArgJ [Magnetococcales bacterium]
MAVGPPPVAPILPPVRGFRLGTAACGIKNGRRERDDLLVVEMAPETRVAGVFTRNPVCAAPVEVCRQRLPRGAARALVVNSGNANAVTGVVGMQATLTVGAAVARLLGVEEREVFVASTGVIGVPLPVEPMLEGVEELSGRLAEDAWLAAARAIMTTDTFPKLAVRQVVIDAQSVTLVGIAKGAGMIRPDMATMLAFLFTDAAIGAGALQNLLAGAVEESFNAITVDGDQSTNDTALLFASGQAGHRWIADPADPALAPFATALNDLCRDLARQIVRDGEGAGKFVTITVTGALSAVQAKQAAMAVANSPLVKTALAGSDPNWGRILAAVGASGVALRPETLTLWLGDVLVLERGQLAEGYAEKKGAAVMAREEIPIRIDLGVGEGARTVWTCDLTHDYITINADYRT